MLSNRRELLDITRLNAENCSRLGVRAANQIQNEEPRLETLSQARSPRCWRSTRSEPVSLAVSLAIWQESRGLNFGFQLGSSEGPLNRRFFGISGADSTVLRFVNSRMLYR